jgi:hypothetical protein
MITAYVSGDRFYGQLQLLAAREDNVRNITPLPIMLMLRSGSLPVIFWFGVVADAGCSPNSFQFFRIFSKKKHHPTSG